MCIRTTAPFFFIMLMAFSLLSCKDKMEEIKGKQWRIDHVQLADGTKIIPENDYITVLEANTFMLKLDVNQCRMKYELAGKNKLKINQGACTRVCCDERAGERIVEELHGIYKVEPSKDGTSLTLRGHQTITLTSMTKEAPTTEAEATKSIRIRRSGCFGGCPIYNMTLFADGRAKYEGKRFVDQIGQASMRLEQEKIKQLFEEAEALDFEAMQDRYDDSSISDLETIFIAYGDHEVTVRWKPGTPEELISFIKNVHDFAMEQRWNVAIDK